MYCKPSYLEVKGVIGVRHQSILISAFQLEAMGNPAVGRAVLAIAVEFGQAVAIAELLEVLVGAVHSSSTQVLHHTWKDRGEAASSEYCKVKRYCSPPS